MAVPTEGTIACAEKLAQLVLKAPAGGIFGGRPPWQASRYGYDGADFRSSSTTRSSRSQCREAMKTWEVEVHLGSGGDTDSIATYLVYAVDEGDAEDVTLGASRHLINVTANLIRNPGAVDEMDYDGVLMSDKVRGLRSVERLGRKTPPTSA